MYSSAGIYDVIIKTILTHAEIRSKIELDGTINFYLFDDGLRQRNKKILQYNYRMDEDGTPANKKKLLDIGMNQIRQVVIDEAQNYTYWHIFLLRQLFPNAYFTILGDENQNINPYIENNKLRNLAPDFEYLEINKAYRSSPEIINFTNTIINAKITPMRQPNNLLVKEYWYISQEFSKSDANSRNTKIEDKRTQKDCCDYKNRR